MLLHSPEGDHLEYVVCLQFQTTNNKAEYEVLLQVLKLAKSFGANSDLIQGDSQLVISQVNGTCEAKEEQMKKYLNKVRQCIKGFTTTQFQQIPKEENAEADALAKTTSTDDIVGDQVQVQYIPSIDITKVNQIDRVANWTSPIMSYLKHGVLPEDKEEARKFRARAVRFVLMDEVLYKGVFLNPTSGV